MINLISSCPLRGATIVWQPAEGLFMLTVICKATFDLQPEESPLAAEQDEPLANDEYWNDSPQGSLRLASDYVPFKRGADVLVIGSAYAPRILPEWPFRARLQVDEKIDKIIDIHGDRVWTKDEKLIESPCPPRISLRWERAGGGPGTENPVGVFPVHMLEIGQPRKVPNFEPPRARLARPSDIIPPAGFGPIAPFWPQRKNLIDPSEGDWDPARWSEKPLASHVDASFFQVAPLDQRLEQLTGDERIQLENLHPHHSRFSTRLAPIFPRAVIQKSNKVTLDLDLRRDTLVIDTDRAVATLTWRASIPLAYAEEWVRVEITTAKKPKLSTNSNTSTSTIALGWEEYSGRPSSPALPFLMQELSNRPRLDPATVPIERYATILAELNEGRATRFRILETHVLTNDDWTNIDAYWKKAIDDDGASGKHDLRRAYDTAYLAAVERFRGPITNEEREKIANSLSRSRMNETLDELKIQRAALMPILRSLTKAALTIANTQTSTSRR